MRSTTRSGSSTGRYARHRFVGGPREECFIGPAARTDRAGGREHAAESRWLWVDLEDPARLDGLYAFLAERPCLLVSSGGGERRSARLLAA